MLTSRSAHVQNLIIFDNNKKSDFRTCTFTRSCSGAGFGTLEIEILDRDGKPVSVELWKKDNETKVSAQ